jgi:hypothetical protein
VNHLSSNMASHTPKGKIEEFSAKCLGECGQELPEERCRVEMVFDAPGKPQAAHESAFDTVGVKVIVDLLHELFCVHVMSC